MFLVTAAGHTSSPALHFHGDGPYPNLFSPHILCVTDPEWTGRPGLRWISRCTGDEGTKST
jgi:hypothetical protein